MSLQPSDLTWWEWYLCSLGCFLVWFGITRLLTDANEDTLDGLIIVGMAFVFMIAGVITGFVGTVRLVKAIWQG